MRVPPRWRSRKFLVTLAAQVTAVLTLLWPAHESAIVEASGAVTALLVMGLSAVGYVATEGAIDRRRVASAAGGDGGGGGSTVE
ncbi:MAG: hypothetical protein GVY27_09000, partial [Deinococcus-Thermus bacterium]|nr:hypothetical protein [Deinococcota bacterium]